MDLQKELLVQINEQTSFDAMYITLETFKALGNSSEDALSELEQLRQKVGLEDKEDTVLELMDIVVGYCSPDKDIW